MKLQITKKTILIIILVVFFVFIDKVLKTLSLKGHLNEPIYLIKGLFSLNFKPNPNIAFSLPLSGPILTIIIALLIISLIYWWIIILIAKNEQKYPKKLLTPLTFLIIGAIINLIDRIKFGYVIDYFDLKYFTIFNIADILISVSIIHTLFLTSQGNKKNDRKI